ncbi:Nse4 C-terminal-domain-containing protein [Scheffersomyces xylosifermentans]|uniref:Nse4 C-terminal-domain-containing protein n=1 Tax=Scheffersomyces xylosifermentans TaxID=1304137 RepID=UPI00315C5B62
MSREEHLHDYEKLRTKLRTKLSEANKGSASGIVLDHINDLRSLYGRVQKEKNRDTKIHLTDSEAFKETSDFAATNARNLKFTGSALALEQKEFVSKLKRYARTNDAVGIANNESEDGEYHQTTSAEEDDDEGLTRQEEIFNQVNWLKLGALYHQVSRRAISVDFLNGPLSTERKRQGPRIRNVDDTSSASSTTARQVRAEDIATDEEQNTAYMVRSVYNTFLEKEEENGVNFFVFFINPNSFAQSVENLFFTSFLIKDGRLKLYLGPDKIPMVQDVSPEEREEARQRASNVETSHHIATLNYQTWKDLIETFNITEAFLGNRDEEEDVIPEEDLEQSSDEEVNIEIDRAEASSSDMEVFQDANDELDE